MVEPDDRELDLAGRLLAEIIAETNEDAIREKAAGALAAIHRTRRRQAHDRFTDE